MKLPSMPSPFSAQKVATSAPLKPVQAEPQKPVVKTKTIVKPAPAPTAEPPAPEIKLDSERLVTEALSYVYAKSLVQVAKETGLPKAKVKKEIDRLYELDYLDEKNGFYRYQNTAPWKVSSLS